MQNQPEIVRILGPDDGGLCVEPKQLGDELVALLSDEARRRALGARAHDAVERNKGAAARTVDIILSRFHTT